VLIADEPTSSLDVSIQAQILDLLTDLRSERGLALVLVTHDLAVLKHMTDTCLVMQNGAVVEEGPTEQMLGEPQHSYTRALVAAHHGVAAGDGEQSAGELSEA
jgi:ABC-type dipeptide/oligopeptide/nickel transport system ATPase component